MILPQLEWSGPDDQGPEGQGAIAGCSSELPDEVLSDNGMQFTGRFGKPRPAEVMFEFICRENGSPTPRPQAPQGIAPRLADRRCHGSSPGGSPQGAGSSPSRCSLRLSGLLRY